MKLHSFRVAIALTAALTTAVSPLLVSAQTAYEYKAYKQGLVVDGANASPGTPAPGPGTPAPQPALQLSTTAIDFGDVATNTTETRQVLVSNPGTGSLSFTTAPAIIGDTAFAAGLTTCGATLSAGEDCLTDATFSPTTTGSYNGVLKFTSVLASSPHEVTLVGIAFNPVSLASTTLPKAMMGKAYSYDFKQLLNVSNEVSPDKSLATWTGSGTLPANLSFNTSTGVLSGTPSAVTPETSYTVTGTYKNNQGQQVYTLKVGDAVLEVVQISAGAQHTCAVTTAGGVKCWGYNQVGTLGDGSLIGRNSPVSVSGLDSGVTSVATGESHSCAVTTAGEVKCWGNNNSGQLGDGTTVNRLTPVSVSGLSTGVTSVAAGGSHTCAVTTGGAAKCWGSNYYGHLGDGSTSQRLTPVSVSGLGSGVASVVTGAQGHTCAVTTTGAVKCWGYNYYGQLGDGTTVNRSTPVSVSGLGSGVASATLGNYHTCAVTTGGAGKCWGSNNYGQLGDGSTSQRLMPVSVSGLDSGVASVSAGGYVTCAVTAAGAAKCWGYNANGYLGDGSTTNRTAPVAVSGLSSGVTSLSTSGSHTCVAAAEGVAKCWGSNGFGQLGDGTKSQHTAPGNVLP